VSRPPPNGGKKKTPSPSQFFFPPQIFFGRGGGPPARDEQKQDLVRRYQRGGAPRRGCGLSVAAHTVSALVQGGFWGGGLRTAQAARGKPKASSPLATNSATVAVAGADLGAGAEDV